jgi:hypothetical protein
VDFLLFLALELLQALRGKPAHSNCHIMSTPNSMENAFANPPSPISKKMFVIAGILTTVYGLEELPSDAGDVACLWLLHPRLRAQSCMEPLAAAAIGDWHKRIENKQEDGRPPGLIAVSFDQRNHGTRLVDPTASEAWRGGNPRHAQDMFSIYRLPLF